MKDGQVCKTEIMLESYEKTCESKETEVFLMGISSAEFIKLEADIW